MSHDDYWNGDPMDLPAMREADRIRADRENRVAWLQGAYVYRALGAMAPALNALSKSSRPADYPKPIELGKSATADPNAEKRRRGVAYMEALMRARHERYGGARGDRH